MSVKVVVVGAGGVIGQHMMVSVPDGVEAVFTRRTGDGVLYSGLDLTRGDWQDFLDNVNPDVVVNLAGENNVDEVEKNPAAAYEVNVAGVALLQGWCDQKGKHLIHVSSQAVLGPVNEYGKQKSLAETFVMTGKSWTIVRPTFVLGVRPFPGIGRENPVERILGGRETVSVCDRFFSVSFAWDVAGYIWGVVLNRPPVFTVQIGGGKFSRWDLVRKLGKYSSSVLHDSLGIASRPWDTTYTDAMCPTDINEGFEKLVGQFNQRELDTAPYRAKEIAAFFKRPWGECLHTLNSGFGPLHNAVSDDFRKANPVGEKELAGWYRGTEAYIWELTAYHLDPGFNYWGMSNGIAEALKSKGAKTVLCLGDGVGDLTLAMIRAGLEPTYNDLFCGTTATFAESRFHMRLGDGWEKKIAIRETATFDPIMTPEEMKGLLKEDEPEVMVYDAIVSLDFLEHVPNVEEWVEAIYANLKPGGWFVAQNAFNMGSGPQGAMPMHLAVNDHYERDWDPLLFSLGFVQEASNWYRKPQ